jgi:hypothetical protein
MKYNKYFISTDSHTLLIDNNVSAYAQAPPPAKLFHEERPPFQVGGCVVTFNILYSITTIFSHNIIINEFIMKNI